MVFATRISAEKVKEILKEKGIHGVEVRPASRGAGSQLIAPDTEDPASLRGNIEGCIEDAVWMN